MKKRNVVKLTLLIVFCVTILFSTLNAQNYKIVTNTNVYMTSEDTIIGITTKEEADKLKLEDEGSINATESLSVLNFSASDEQFSRINNTNKVIVKDGYKITIDGLNEFYTSDIKYYEDAIDNIYRLNLPESAYQTYKITNTVPKYTMNNKNYESFRISSDVEITKGKYNERNLLNSQSAVQYYLMNGSNLPKYETIDGEINLQQILNKNNITETEFYLNNPMITKTSLLPKGTQVIVNKPVYSIRYTAVFKDKVVRTLPYQTFTQPNSSLDIGDKKVSQEGRNGEETAWYSNVEVNGQIVDRKLQSNSVNITPVNKIIQEGTHEIPGVGSGKLIWPHACYTVTAGIGGYAGHVGVDISCGYGTDIYAVDNGVVKTNAYMPGGYGNYVEIDHNNGMTSIYAHMNQRSFLKIGEVVRQGDVVGYEGSTGNSTGSHLHIELHLYKNPDNIPIAAPGYTSDYNVVSICSYIKPPFNSGSC